MWNYISDASTKKPQAELDRDPWTSPNHPPLEELPLPEAHLQRLWAIGQGAAPGRAKPKSMKVLEFYDVMREHSEEVRTEEDLWALARTRQDTGDRKLMEFLLSRRDLPQLLERVAKAEGAPENAKRSRQSRLQILEEVCTTGRCVCAEPGRWKAAAQEVVHLNGYRSQELEVAILEALELGRAKMRTIMIVGGTNRAKSFCLKPLALVYRAYTSPDTGSHQLADLKGSEVLWLNEFEFDASFMPWRKLKDFLEGEPPKVAVPKNEGRNYIFRSDAPVFCTGPGPVEHPTQPRETAQMDSRIRYFLFQFFFDPATCPEIKPCPTCFAQWLLAARGRPRPAPGPPPAGLQEYYGRTRGKGAGKRSAWHVQRPQGTYQEDDLPGACFKCGRAGHRAAECDQ
jgi:hypothetical protein